MSIWKIAEYAVGILFPLGVFWAGERGGFRWVGMGKGTPDSARRSSPESEAKRGALPPLRSPFQDSGHHAHPWGGVLRIGCDTRHQAHGRPEGDFASWRPMAGFRCDTHCQACSHQEGDF